MLKFNNNSSDNSSPQNSNSNFNDQPTDPFDPNSPQIPDNVNPYFDSDIDTSPPKPHELQAFSGESIRGIATDIGESVALELANNGITREQVIALAAAWGVSVAQAGAIAVTRSVARNLNRMFARNFGGSGGSGGPPTITFYGSNESDGGSGPGGPGSGGPSSHGNMIDHPLMRQHLDTNGKPGEATFNVGLKVPAYVPYYKEYVSGYSSPMHLTCAIPQMPTLTDYPLGRFNNQAILLRFIERVSRSVSYQLSDSTFTTSNINNYFNNILKGLSYYYWFESIYAYSYNKVDTNDALVFLRRNMTAEEINTLMILKSTLASLPIPPNMIKLVYWMFQNWQVHSLADSPVIKICPFTINPSTGLPDTATAMATVLTDLNSSSNRSITSTLVKAFDEWYKMDLPCSSITLEHNTDFTTLWANLPGVRIDTTAPTSISRTPGVVAINNSVPYQTFTDELDGAIIGMLSIWDSTTAGGQWAPSLIAPVNTVNGTNTTNRFSWFGTSFKFKDPCLSPNIALQRPETHVIVPGYAAVGGVSFGSEVIIHNAFAERLTAININAVSEVGMQLVQWMLNFEIFNTLAGSAGDVMRSAPRGKALNESASPSNKKPTSRWTKIKQRNSSSPEIDAAINSQLGEL